VIGKKISAHDKSTILASEEDSKYKPNIIFYDVNTSDFDNHLTSFQRMEMFVEFKRGNTFDPFRNELPFEKLFETTCETRGQIVDGDFIANNFDSMPYWLAVVKVRLDLVDPPTGVDPPPSHRKFETRLSLFPFTFSLPLSC
jgi:hypothetical protein